MTLAPTTFSFVEGPQLTVAEDHLDAVDLALARLDDGTYGTCAACRAPVGDAVLAADPTASVCAGHGFEPAT